MSESVFRGKILASAEQQWLCEKEDSHDRPQPNRPADSASEKPDAEELERQKRQKAYFMRTYDKLKEYPFKALEELNLNHYIGLHKYAGQLSPNAWAVYVVLCTFADYADDKWFQLSLKNIAKFAGISIPTVDSVMEELTSKIWPDGDGFPLVERQKVTEGQRRFWEYRVRFVRKEYQGESNKKKWFALHTVIVKSGIWARLNMRAKALYIGMRHHSQFEEEAYGAIDGHCSGERSDRQWEICKKSVSSICREMGISRGGIRQVIDQLEDEGLIEHFQSDVYGSIAQVYKLPKGEYS